MVSNISYIDDTRVAVWGWSYGGYLAAQILAEDDRRLISCAVSVAPVVKWQLYGKFFFKFPSGPQKYQKVQHFLEKFHKKNPPITWNFLDQY